MTKSYLAKGLTGLALAATVVAGGMLSVSAPASAAVGDYEQLNAYNSDLVAAMPDPFTKNDDQVVMAVYDDMAYNGQWIREPVAGKTDTYTFRNRWSNQCLDTENGNSTTAGTPVVQRPCDKTASQNWVLIHDDIQPTWHIKNSNSGLYLGIENGSTSAGAGLKQANYAGNNESQQWQIW